METNQSHPSNSFDETVRVSSDKLALMLEERGIPVPGQPVPPTSTTSSGATNPFTSRELEDMRRQGRIEPAAPGNDPWVVPRVVPEIVPEVVSQVVSGCSSGS